MLMQLLHFLYLLDLIATFLTIFSPLVLLLTSEELLLDEHQLFHPNCFSNPSLDLFNQLTEGLIISILAGLRLGYPEVELHSNNAYLRELSCRNLHYLQRLLSLLLWDVRLIHFLFEASAIRILKADRAIEKHLIDHLTG